MWLWRLLGIYQAIQKIFDNWNGIKYIVVPNILFALLPVGRINNLDELKEECFKNGKVQFMEMSNGLINQTEMVAALINLKNDVIEGFNICFIYYYHKK